MSATTINSLVHTLSYSAKKRADIFRTQPVDKQAAIALKLTKVVLADLLTKLSDEEVVVLTSQLDPDKATDILQNVSTKRRNKILDQLAEYLKNSISLLLQFDEDTAAGLMSLEYIQVESTDSITAVLERVKIHEKRTSKLPTMLVMESGTFIGYLPGYQLGLARQNSAVGNYVKPIVTVLYTDSNKQVVNHFKRNLHRKVVVLGEHKEVLGVIYSDDILKLIEDNESSSLYDFAGVSSEESIYDSSARKIKFRYRWLMLNLATAFLAAFTVSMFNEIISKNVLLAVYMPIVAGMGGNAGTQTLAVLVRGLSSKQITFRSLMTILKNELGAGLVHGSINGAVVMAIVTVINKSLAVGVVLGTAMVINLLVASFFGTIVPYIMKRLGKDPASSATIFITTATDVLGFLAFLGLASTLL